MRASPRPAPTENWAGGLACQVGICAGFARGLFSGVSFVLFCTLMFRVIREGGGGCTSAWIFRSGTARFQSPISNPQSLFSAHSLASLGDRRAVWRDRMVNSFYLLTYPAQEWGDGDTFQNIDGNRSPKAPAPVPFGHVPKTARFATHSLCFRPCPLAGTHKFCQATL